MDKNQIDKHIQEIIDKYLQNLESSEERKILYDWFDTLDTKEQLTFPELSFSRERAKERFFMQIANDGESVAINSNKSVKFIWFRNIAASLLLLATSYLIYDTYIDQGEAIDIDSLVEYKADPSKATLTLPNGEVIVLDNDHAQYDGSHDGHQLMKDSEGIWKYVGGDKVAPSDQINVLETPLSGQFCIILSDGTKVWLNAGSKLKYPESFGNGNRIVQLEGEAYFQVNKTTNNSKFIVETSRQTVHVLGTKFNIKAYPHQSNTLTTLETGSLQVNKNNSAAEGVLLVPNQQSVLSGADFTVRDVDIEGILAWTKGFFYFDGTNTHEVLKQIAAWYDIDITYKEKAKHSQYVGKISQNLTLDQVVKLLDFADLKVTPTLKDNRVNLIVN